MTAIATMLDCQTRPAQPAQTQPTPSTPKGLFAKLVEDHAGKPKAVDLADPAILALLHPIPKGEMPPGIPEVIATEVSLVMDLPSELDLELGPAGSTAGTPLPVLESRLDLFGHQPHLKAIPPIEQAPDLPAMPRQVRATKDLMTIDAETEISDGIPVATAGAPRPARQGSDPAVDITALQLQLVPPVRDQVSRETVARDQVSLARTLVAIPTSFVDDAALSSSAPVVHLPVRFDAKTIAIAKPPLAVPVTPLTPLEQAVQTLIAEIAEREEHAPSSTTSEQPLPVAFSVDAPKLALDPARAVAPVIGPREIAAQPESHNPSHVHLVIDDGMERVVVTVAVRGSDVNIAMRGTDDATTAALARNAGTLDHAMRGRGLDLQSFVADQQQDRREAQRERQEQRRDRRPQELFSIEELA